MMRALGLPSLSAPDPASEETRSSINLHYLCVRARACSVVNGKQLFMRDSQIDMYVMELPN